MQKRKGEAWYHYHVNDVRVYVDRGGEGSPVERTTDLVVSAPSAGVSNIREVKGIQLLVQNKECVRKMRPFDQ